MIRISNVRDFDTDHIFDCGQCFRWEREDDGSYTGIASGNIANIRYDAGSVVIDGDGDEDFWRNYLDLDRDYGKIKGMLSGSDEVIREAVKAGEGIRILNQDRWETLISFVISQNNNIPRIKGCIDKLCSIFGEYAGSFRGKEFYTFPEKSVLASADEEALAPVRLGYRAGYICDISRTDMDLEAESLKPTDELYDFLLSLKGVGPKVANCILLFGFARLDCFPIDVWVKRVMNRLYGFDEKDTAGMKRFAAERFGEYGGIAQQYLFRYITHLK